MPRRKKGSKSQAIREQLKQNPKATAKEVIDALAQKQIKVKPGLVYFIKGQVQQKKVARKRKAARVAKAGQKMQLADPVALIRKVKELAREAGGLENLNALIAVLAE
jgi:hypothetical protein